MDRAVFAFLPWSTEAHKTGPLDGRRTPEFLDMVSKALGESTARGFEPLRAEPNGFPVHHLSHSVTLSRGRQSAETIIVQ